MALSLTAERKNFDEFFSSDIIYKIPEYQRAYSWTRELCQQMYYDIENAYRDDKREYFLGNLILAKSDKPKNLCYVVDGQQRLTTIWLMMKVISLMYPEINTPKGALSVKAREGDERILRIQATSEDNKDNNSLSTLLKLSSEDFVDGKRMDIGIDNPENKVFDNFCYLKDTFGYYQKKFGDEKTKDFIYFIIDSIFLLPIELYNDDITKAEDQALDIFETINNRGMNLEDADIFKSKIYKRALGVDGHLRFIELWESFKDNCFEKNLSVDDVFRYYSHIIRGRNGITTAEKKMRDFFLKEEFSPLLTLPYYDVMDDLFKILDTIEFITKEKQNISTELGAWIFLVCNYSNGLPFTALLSYLFEYGTDDKNNIISFCKKIVRYSYSQGATFSIKFTIYSVIADIFSHRIVKDFYVGTSTADIVDNPGRLREKLMYLYYFLSCQNQQEYLTVDKIYNAKDWQDLDKDVRLKHESAYDSLGNYIILDCPRKTTLFSRRCKSYSQSKLDEVGEMFQPSLTFNPAIISRREKAIKKILNKFFCSND